MIYNIYIYIIYIYIYHILYIIFYIIYYILSYSSLCMQFAIPLWTSSWRCPGNPQFRSCHDPPHLKDSVPVTHQSHLSVLLKLVRRRSKENPSIWKQSFTQVAIPAQGAGGLIRWAWRYLLPYIFIIPSSPEIFFITSGP